MGRQGIRNSFVVVVVVVSFIQTFVAAATTLRYFAQRSHLLRRKEQVSFPEIHPF